MRRGVEPHERKMAFCSELIFHWKMSTKPRRLFDHLLTSSFNRNCDLYLKGAFTRGFLCARLGHWSTAVTIALRHVQNLLQNLEIFYHWTSKSLARDTVTLILHIFRWLGLCKDHTLLPHVNWCWRETKIGHSQVKKFVNMPATTLTPLWCNNMFPYNHVLPPLMNPRVVYFYLIEFELEPGT